MQVNSQVFHINEVDVTDDSDHLHVNSQGFYVSEHFQVTHFNFIRVR